MVTAQRRTSSRISARASTVHAASPSSQPASIRKRKQQLLSLPKLILENRNVLVDLVQWMEKAGRIAIDQATILVQQKREEAAALQQAKAAEEQRKREQEEWERKMAEKRKKLEQRRAEQEARKRQLEEERLEQARLEREASEKLARIEQAEAARIEAERIEREHIAKAEERERAERLAAELEAQAKREREEAAERERQQEQRREEERLEMERKEAEKREQERAKEKLEEKARLRQKKEARAAHKREEAAKRRRAPVAPKKEAGPTRKELAEEKQKQAAEAEEAAKRQSEEKARRAVEEAEREAMRLEKERVEAERERLLKIEQRIRVKEERIKAEGERLRVERRALKERAKQDRDAARERKRAERQAARERARLEAARLAEEEERREARLKEEEERRSKTRQAARISTKQRESKRKQADNDEAPSRQTRSVQDKPDAVKRGRKPKEPVQAPIPRLTKQASLPKKRTRTKPAKSIAAASEAESSPGRSSIFETPAAIKTKTARPAVLKEAATPIASAKDPTPAVATTVRRAKRLAAKESVAPTPQKPVASDVEPLAEPFAEPKVESWTLQFLKTKNLDRPKPAVPLYSKPVEVPLPEESPLTKAKKLDAENQWRQQLLSAKSETAKRPGSSSAQPALDDFGTVATPPPPLIARPASEKPIESVQKPFMAPPSKPTSEHPKPVDNPFDHIEFVAPSNLPIRVGRVAHPVKHTPAKTRLLQATHAPMIDAEAPPADLLRSVEDEVAPRQTQTAVAVEIARPSQQQSEAAPRPPPLQQPLIQHASSESDDVFETSKLCMQHGVEAVNVGPPTGVCGPQDGSNFAKVLSQQHIPTQAADDKAAQRKRLQERQAAAIDKKRRLLEKAAKPSISSTAPAQSSKLTLPPVDQARLATALLQGKSAVAAVQNQNINPNTNTASGPAAMAGKPLRVVAGVVKTANPTKPTTPEKYKAPVKASVAKSPTLPSIPSDEDGVSSNTGAPIASLRPPWAATPALRQAIASQSQSTLRPEDIFGDVQPIRLEDFFADGQRKFRSRASSSNWNI